MKLKLETFKKSVLFESLEFLPKRDRTLLGLVLSIQIILGLLDFLGIVILGAIGSLSVTIISSAKIGDRVQKFLNIFGLSEQTLQYQVAVLGLLAAMFLVGKTLISYWLNKKTLIFLSRRGGNISAGLISKVLSAQLDFLQKRSIQDYIYSASGGVTAIFVGVIGGWINLISDIALLIILGAGLIFVDFKVALLVLLIFSSIAWVLHTQITRRMQSLGKNLADLAVENANQISEVVLAYREIFVRNRRLYYGEKIGNRQRNMADGNARTSLANLTSKYVFEIALVVSCVIVSAIQFLTQPVVQAVGILTIFLGSSVRIMPAVLRIQQGVLKIRLQSGWGERTLELKRDLSKIKLEIPTESSFRNEYPGFVGSLSIKGLSFKFDSNDPWHLEIPSLEVGEGEFAAIVGPSGAGKTTLVDLILGLRIPLKGSIRISGKSPSDAISEWGGAISYVPQDSAVFAGTIRSNIGLGFDVEEIDDDLFWKALSISHLDDFVRTLDNGLDTYVGDRGVRLSGGQRQRLGIARAFFTNPRIVVLDEATSSLDAEIEVAISESIRAMRGSTTLVVIAHRLSTITTADNIVYLDGGNVLGVGTFERLKLVVPDFANQASLMGL